MPLTDREITTIFDRTTVSLKEAGLSWVLEQVLEQIRLGKPAAAKVKELQARRRNTGVRRQSDEEVLTSGPTREYRTTIEYSPLERLELLLGAVEQVLIVAPSIEDSVSSHFPSARFITDTEPFVIRTRTASQIASTEKFRELVIAIRREIGIDGHQ